LAAATRDIGEYVVELNKAYGLAPGLTAPPGASPCTTPATPGAEHGGGQSAEMLRLTRGKIDLVERAPATAARSG